MPAIWRLYASGARSACRRRPSRNTSVAPTSKPADQRLDKTGFTAGRLTLGVRNPLGWGLHSASLRGSNRGFSRQEASQADVEEEAPQDAEAHARPAPQTGQVGHG